VSEVVAELHKIIDLLDDKQVETLYNVAVSFVALIDPDYTKRRDFDYISPEESDEIERAFEEIRRGDCTTYIPEDELTEFLETSFPNSEIHFHINHAENRIRRVSTAKGEKKPAWRVKRKLTGK